MALFVVPAGILERKNPLVSHDGNKLLFGRFETLVRRRKDQMRLNVSPPAHWCSQPAGDGIPGEGARLLKAIDFRQQIARRSEL